MEKIELVNVGNICGKCIHWELDGDHPPRVGCMYYGFPQLPRKNRCKGFMIYRDWMEDYMDYDYNME